MTGHSANLESLAAHLGILPEYFDQAGERHFTSDDTRRALLGAMGVQVDTDDDARDAMERLLEQERRTIVAPVRVLEQYDPAIGRVEVRTPPSRARGPWRLDVELEDGRRYVADGQWRGDETMDLALPPDIPLGYHQLTITLSDAGVEWSDEQTLIVVPNRCVLPDTRVGSRGAFGVIANLYSVRSESNWGIGDFSDLAALGEWAAEVDADFVGVNPLHALLDRGADISPYSPVSRRFRNTIYIDVLRVPELEFLPDLRERLASPEMSAQLESLREPEHVCYDQVMSAKGLALDALHDAFTRFVRESGSERDRAYEAFVHHNEPELSRFAVWMTLVERFASAPKRSVHPTDWRTWPAEFRDPDSEAVQSFAEAHADRVDYHRWLQFETDRQLGEAARRMRDAGMRIGLYQDLAIGTSPCGADTWSNPQLFAAGACVGAPPDPLATQGQDWGMPPLDPRALRENRYRYFIDLVRAGLRYAGALRIDHMLGLFRLFWIPKGKSGTEGAYVRYPAADLLGILALESVRHDALIVGEDLGTVPADVPPTLAKWGILSSKVLQFEREWDGGYKPSDAYPHLALATANTHDMATIAGFWAGRDIDVRRDVGLIASDDDYARAQNDRDNDRRALLHRLASERLLPDAIEPTKPATLRGAIHAFLCRSPASLVGLSLDDLAGEMESVNVPGIGVDQYPCWSRRMSKTIGEIAASSDTEAALRCDGRMGRQVDA
ncbi:MAG TPA: 4-alpha-glucanotransferase [Gemmatimonadaceae bacterium]